MSTNKVFFHVAANCGGCNGIGQMFATLDAANIPFAVYSANDAGLIVESAKYKNATLIYRDVHASTIEPSEYKVNFDTAALRQWARQMYALPPEIKAMRNRVFIELMNEPDHKDGNANWVGAVSARMARIALSEGYRVMSAGWSPGTPEPEHWLTQGWREYLQLAANHPDKVAVSLHEYSLSNDIHEGEGWLIGRFKHLFAACDQMKIKRPNVWITECGWSLNSASSDMMKDIRYLAELYAGYPEIKAAFLWTLQAGKGNGDLPQRLNALIKPLTDYTIETRFPDPTPDPPQPPQEPPMEQYKVTVVLLPPTTKPEQAAGVARYRHPMRQTITYSLDDMDRLMPPLNPQARADSEVIAYNFVDWDEAGKARIRRHRYKAQAFGGKAQQPEPEPPAGPVIGTDVSKWQGAIDFKKMKAAGAQFTFIRCSYGTFEDERLSIYAPAALAAGLPYGFYAYYHPWQDPIEQADLIISLVNKYGVDFPVAVDLEEPKNVPGDYTARVKRCLDHLTAALGRKPIIYTSAGYWSGTLKSPSFGKDYDLWIAAWTTAASPAIPAPWSDWRFWQYTSDGKGSDYGVSSARIDLNRWNGTAAQLAAYRVERKPAANTIDLRRFKIADPDCWRVVRMPDGRQEDVQDMDLGGGMFVRRKGDNGEWHRQDGQLFYLIHDTSPDKGEEGIERVYTLYKDGKPGAPKSRVFQAVGEEWIESGTHTVQFRAKSSCLPLSENSGQARNSSVIVRYEKNYTFNRYGQGLTFDEVVWEKTGVETQIYGRMNGRACGWIGWSAPWGESEPVEVHWNRGRLTQEPKRWCSWG